MGLPARRDSSQGKGLGQAREDSSGAASALSDDLKHLSVLTRIEDNRQRYVSTAEFERLIDLVPQILSLLERQGPEGHDPVLYLLRILRNVCACGEAATAHLVESGIHNSAIQLLDYEEKSIAKVAAQLLANLSTSAAASRDKLWQSLRRLYSSIQFQEHIAGPMADMVRNCCLLQQQDLDQCEILDLDRIATCLLEHLQAEDGDTSLGLLALHFCFAFGTLPGLQADSAAGMDNASPANVSRLACWHADVLQILTNSLQNPPLSCTIEAMCKLGATTLAVAEQLSRAAHASYSWEAEVLHSSMRFLRALTSMDDTISSLGQAATEYLIRAAKLLETLLAILAALGPIRSRRPDKTQKAAWPAFKALQPHLYCSVQPYNGFRSDLVAVLANSVYHRKVAQDKMQSLGGVELMLCHCQVDDESPFLREVALWGIRNLCEGNLSIQKQIEELQIMDVADSPELDAAGLKLQHDPRSGKVSVIQAST